MLAVSITLLKTLVAKFRLVEVEREIDASVGKSIMKPYFGDAVVEPAKNMLASLISRMK